MTASCSKNEYAIDVKTLQHEQDFGCLSTLSCSEADVNRSGIFLICCQTMRMGASCCRCVCGGLISMLALLSSQEYKCLMPAHLNLVRCLELST